MTTTDTAFAQTVCEGPVTSVSFNACVRFVRRMRSTNNRKKGAVTCFSCMIWTLRKKSTHTKHTHKSILGANYFLINNAVGWLLPSLLTHLDWWCTSCQSEGWWLSFCSSTDSAGFTPSVLWKLSHAALKSLSRRDTEAGPPVHTHPLSVHVFLK